MKKRTVFCFLIFTVCAFYSSIAHGVSLAQQVLRKHNKTFQREEVRTVLPQVLEGLKAPDTQVHLNPRTINLVVDNPDLLPIFIPDIKPQFVTLLKRDQELKNFLRDPQVQRLLQNPAAIDELAGLLGIRGVDAIADGRANLPDLPAKKIYNQAIHSVVWIYTEKGNWTGKGSGVLIDKKRRLIVTNQHVTRNADRIYVFFPKRNRNDQLIRKQIFYMNSYPSLKRQGYATEGKVVAKNVKNDLAIIQLVRIPTTAREIKHDFSQNVEDDMRKRDKVHILGNPGERLWNWTQGTFLQDWRDCLPSGGDCLELEGDAEGGNSGGPVLNGQGMFIGILTAGTDDTVALASPARNVRALLNTVPANLVPITLPQQIYPKRVFKIRNSTGVTVPYQIRWSNNNSWKPQSLETGFVLTHRSGGQRIPEGYPKIRFDYIAGDSKVTYRYYNLDTALFRENNDNASTYFFQYNRRGDKLHLYRAAGAAPVLSSPVPENTILLSNYPNPFNPETWIPYKLSKSAEVTVTIHTADGRLIRTLSLGHQSAGVYQNKSRAAYWDGKNAFGEPVASGIYFCTLIAGDFTATRKMLIRK